MVWMVLGEDIEGILTAGKRRNKVCRCSTNLQPK
jgi:hypothetical protein